MLIDSFFIAEKTEKQKESFDFFTVKMKLKLSILRLTSVIIFVTSRDSLEWLLNRDRYSISLSVNLVTEIDCNC
jgi:hypothetical protein